MRNSTDERTKVAAARELIDRGYGKSAQPMVGEDGTGPMTVVHRISWIGGIQPEARLPECIGQPERETAPLH